MRISVWVACGFACAAVLPLQAARAWGADGHHSVGIIAERLLAGSRAARHVKALLGELTLGDAAVWADCVKGIAPSQGYSYQVTGRYPECAIYETPAGEAAMSDFVRRNDDNCDRKPTEESCHAQYHYSDVAIQRSTYVRGSVGTREDDLIAAVVAATRVLQGRPAPAPFSFKGPREALLVLTHYVGDLHQPLHVAAVYLDSGGRLVDPDAGALDPSTETRGGNQLIPTGGAGRKGRNFHAIWDAVPTELKPAYVDAAWLAEAKRVPRTRGSLRSWPTRWASESVGVAHEAFAGLEYGAADGGYWSVTLPPGYAEKMAMIKRRQLTLGGARLAQLLRAIWP